MPLKATGPVIMEHHVYASLRINKNLQLWVAETHATIATVVSEAAHSNGCIRHTPEYMTSQLCTPAASIAALLPHTPADASVVQSTSYCITNA